VTNNGGSGGANNAIGDQGAQLLLANVTDARQTFGGLGLSKTLPIGTADAGSFFNNEVLAQVDYGVSIYGTQPTTNIQLILCMY
jgi:hypothetical protein